MNRSLFFQSLFIISILFGVLNTGCSTVRGWVGATDPKEVETEKQQTLSDKYVRFSDNQNLASASQRQYKRMTKSKMEEESELHAQAGSMWVMEGQGAYLFTQNKSRKEGDLLNVRIEGTAQKQVETKVSVIKKLLKQLEDEQKKAKEAEQNKQQSLAAVDQQTTQGARNPASATPTAAEKDEPIEIELVPTRITERTGEGNYRIKGAQPFMIGKREYKVIVTGLIRPEDFNDEGISSNKLLDPQFDVVSLRRKNNDEI